MANKSSSSILISSSSSLIEEEAFETLSDFSDSVSDAGSWLVIDPSDSDNDDVITTTDEEEEEEGVVSDVDDVMFQPYGSPASSDISVQSLLDEITNNHSQDFENDTVVKHEVLINGGEDPCHEEVTEQYEIDDIRQFTGLTTGGDDLYDEEVTDVNEINNSRLINSGYQPYEEDEDEEEEEDDDELDDELVPKWLSNKFERQRMRKLGKKVYPKMKKSKRMVNQYNMPGCVRGKHGLGLKHNVIW